MSEVEKQINETVKEKESIKGKRTTIFVKR